jgi:hypothetical protein
MLRGKNAKALSTSYDLFKRSVNEDHKANVKLGTCAAPAPAPRSFTNIRCEVHKQARECKCV